MTDRTAAELEVDAEAARAQVTNTAESIRSKMSPGQLIDEFSGIFTGGDGAATLTNLKGQIRDNPLPLTLIGAGLAWLMLGTGTSSSTGSSNSNAVRRTPIASSAGAATSPVLRSPPARGGTTKTTILSRNGETPAEDQQGMVASALESATALVADAADASRSALDTAKGAVRRCRRAHRRRNGRHGLQGKRHRPACPPVGAGGFPARTPGVGGAGPGGRHGDRRHVARHLRSRTRNWATTGTNCATAPRT